jgi:hypothetical protein
MRYTSGIAGYMTLTKTTSNDNKWKIHERRDKYRQ